MKICVTSANLGKIDGMAYPKRVPQITPEGWEVDWLYHDHSNVTLRNGSLHPRIQAKIFRMLGWEIYPGYDYYRPAMADEYVCIF